MREVTPVTVRKVKKERSASEQERFDQAKTEKSKYTRRDSSDAQDDESAISK